MQSADWPNVNNDKEGTRYSPLTQINRENVHTLQVAWTYHTGDAAAGTTIECTPLVIDGVMYITTAGTCVVALDAATGRVLWKHDPYPDGITRFRRASGGVNRGVAWWSDGRPDGQRRILVGLSDGRLLSLDAASGKLDPAFGDPPTPGEVDLRAGIEREDNRSLAKLAYGPTSAPMVFEDLVIFGFSNSEQREAAPGDTRAFDVRTGRQVWRFHAIPRPGEFGHDTWHGDEWKDRGGANAWGGFTLDTSNGILFCGTGSVSADFFGGDRKGPNLFANCTLALDARTGKRLWHFQNLRHDLWDHDSPAPPVVVTVNHDGQQLEAVAQLTKSGYCYLLERHTGRPLFGVTDVAAVPSDIPGEEASATQPLPLKPPALSRVQMTLDDVTDISPESRAFVLKQLEALRHGARYIPPSETGTLVVPGFRGGATWSGASFDPTTGYLYVNTNNVPGISALKRNSAGGYDFAGYRSLDDHEGYPGIKPPWGNLTAIDLNTGEFAWQIVLGEYPELTARGVPRTGTQNFGGTIVTAGGLVFIGGTKDEKFHAFDKANGRLLWDYKLPAGGYATPCTYAVNGRQYIAIAAGGGGKQATASSDAFVVFTLP